MKSEANDIYEMLDTLALPAAAQRFAELSESPELGSYTALQLLREVLEPQYIETLNKRFETNLRLSSLINKGAVAENLKTGYGRIYNDATVEQVLKFHFAENRQNVGIYGVTGAGKVYISEELTIPHGQSDHLSRRFRSLISERDSRRSKSFL